MGARKTGLGTGETIAVIGASKFTTIDTLWGDEGTWLARRPGNLAGPEARHVALPDLVLGEKPGRQNNEEISCFYISTPSGAQVAYMGSMILERAKSQGLGREIPDEWFSQDEKD